LSSTPDIGRPDDVSKCSWRGSICVVQQRINFMLVRITSTEDSCMSVQKLRFGWRTGKVNQRNRTNHPHCDRTLCMLDLMQK
jgi:hypothetical protein